MPGSYIRKRLLNCLDRSGVGLDPAKIATIEVDDLFDIRNFGWAAMYECQKWLAEYELSNPAIDNVLRLHTEYHGGNGNTKKGHSGRLMYTGNAESIPE